MESPIPIRHTSLIAANSTGFTLWPSRHPMALSSPAAYPNRSLQIPQHSQDRLQCRRPDPPKILPRATQVTEKLVDLRLHTVSRRLVTHFPHPSMGHPIPEEFPDDSRSPPASPCLDPPYRTPGDS
jgi:hypothetical protein